MTLTNGLVEVWNVTNTAKPFCVFRPNDSRLVVTKAFNADESKMATASQAQAANTGPLILEVWDLRTGEPLIKPVRFDNTDR